MLNLFYQKLVPAVHELHTFCRPYVSSVKDSTVKVSKLFEEHRKSLIEVLGSHKEVIIAGVTTGVALYWLYLFFFDIEPSVEAKRRSPIPFSTSAPEFSKK